MGVVGNDEPGTALMQKLRDAGVDCSGVIVSQQYRTTTKVRVLAGQTHSTRQQVIRIDYGSETELDIELREQLAAQVADHFRRRKTLRQPRQKYGERFLAVQDEEVVEVLELREFALLLERPGDRSAEDVDRVGIALLEPRPRLLDRVHVLIDPAERKHVGRPTVAKLLVPAVDDGHAPRSGYVGGETLGPEGHELRSVVLVVVVFGRVNAGEAMCHAVTES